MGPLLQQAAGIITSAAGWKTAQPKEGVFHFSLEGDLDFELLTPENRTGVLLAEIAPLSSVPEEADALISKLAKLACGVMKKRRSVIAVASNRVELYRTFDLTDKTLFSPQSALPDIVRDFLNDLAWWKAQIHGASPSAAAAASPFSMGGWSFGSFIH